MSQEQGPQGKPKTDLEREFEAEQARAASSGKSALEAEYEASQPAPAPAPARARAVARPARDPGGNVDLRAKPAPAPAAPQTFRDSVTAITGTPTLGTHDIPGAATRVHGFGKEINGVYNPILDFALVNKDLDGPAKDHAFTHEMGHRLDSRFHGDPKARAAFDSARTVPGTPKPTGYAATSDAEHFSEAFANATELLRRLGGKLPPSPDAAHNRALAIREMQAAEQAMPGTMVLARYLLDQPLYADHWMQQVRDDGGPHRKVPPKVPGIGAARDATAAPVTARERYRPNVVERTAKMAVDMVPRSPEAAMHMAKEIIAAPVRSLLQSTSGALERGFLDAGGRPEDRAITDEEYTNANAQTIANTAMGPIESVIAKRAMAAGASNTVAHTLGSALANVPAGAAYSPDDPAAGALLGAGLAPVFGAAHAGARRGAPILRDASVAGARAVGAGVRAAGDAATEAGRSVRGVLPNLRAKRGLSALEAEYAQTRELDTPPTLAEVDDAITTLRNEHATATDEIARGELEKRLSVIEAQRRKLTGEPEPEMATAAASRAAQAAGVRSIDAPPAIDQQLAKLKARVAAGETVAPDAPARRNAGDLDGPVPKSSDVDVERTVRAAEIAAELKKEHKRKAIGAEDVEPWLTDDAAEIERAISERGGTLGQMLKRLQDHSDQLQWNLDVLRRMELVDETAGRLQAIHGDETIDPKGYRYMAAVGFDKARRELAGLPPRDYASPNDPIRKLKPGQVWGLSAEDAQLASTRLDQWIANVQSVAGLGIDSFDVFEAADIRDLRRALDRRLGVTDQSWKGTTPAADNVLTKTGRPEVIDTRAPEPTPPAAQEAAPPAPASRADRIIMRGEGIPAVRTVDGKVFSRRDSEHGDIIHQVEMDQDADFSGPDVDTRGWMLDGEFVSVRDLDAESIEGVHYVDTNKPTAPPVEPPAPPKPSRKSRVLVEDEDGTRRFEEARGPAGGRRPVGRVTTKGLLHELIEMEQRRADAEARSVYEYRQDENFHTSGIPQIVSTKGRGANRGGPSMQAKAARNLEDFTRITDEIHAELQRRGLMPEEIFDRIEDVRTELAERAGQAGDYDARNLTRDMVTDDEGRPLFDPEPSPLEREFARERDLFGEVVPDETPAQQSMFGAKEGTAESRTLRETEAAARAELDRLRAEQKLETDGPAYQARAKRIAQLEALTNRGEKIGADEMAQRAAAEGRPLAEGPDQQTLFSPLTDLSTAIGKKFQQMTGGGTVGIGKGAQQARVESLREISSTLAEGVGVPLREGRFKAKQRRALGAFFPHKEVARIVRMDKIDTAAHEIGHYVSKHHLRNPTMKGAASRGALKMPTPAMRELVKMGRDLYGTRKPAGGYGEEGIAQWARFYVTDHARLTKDAPVFSQWVEQNVLAKEPALQQSLDLARQRFEAWAKAPADARVDAMISVSDQGLLAGAMRGITTPERRQWLARKLVTWMLDDLGEIKRSVDDLGGAKTPKEDAYILARLTRGAAGIAEEMLHRGIINPETGARVAPAVVKVIESLKPSDHQPFRRYLVAQRAIELAGRGVDAGIQLADAHEIVRLYDGEYRARAEQLWQVSQSLIDYRVAKGLLTAKEGAAIKRQNQRRVGFYRVFTDEETGGRKGTGKGFGRNSSGVKRAVGSSREIIDPLESITKDVYETVQQAHAHEAAVALYKHALETEGGGRIVEEVPAPQLAVEIPLERIKKQLEDLGLDLSDADLSGVVRSFQDATVAGAREAKDLVLPVIIDGERKWLQIKDAQLYDALQGLNQQQLPMWQRIVGGPSRLLRLGATHTPEFIARNPVRDAFASAINSQGPTRPPGYLAAEGLFHIAKRDDLFQRWKLAGGANADMLGLDRKTVQQNLDQLTRSTHGKAIDLVRHPIDALRMISGLMENATRVGEFAAVARKGERAGMSRRDVDVSAAMASREVTLDFAKGGQVSRAANSLVSFFNANLLGNAKLVQELRENPGRAAPRIAAFITIPSITLYLMQRNDPDYQEVPQWQKDVSWVVVDRNPDGSLNHIWRIPKPPGLGIVFGSTFERALQFIDSHDPEAIDGMAADLLDTMNPFHMPDAIRPLNEWWANKSTFRDRPIVPAGMEKLPPAEQSTRYTGEAARLLGRHTNLSPAKIENAVEGYTAGLGTLGMQGADAAVRTGRRLLGQEPLAGAEASAGDWQTKAPVVRGFAVRVPGNDAESIKRTVEDFHEAESHRLAWTRMLNKGDQRGAAAYFEKHRAAIGSVATREDMGGEAGPLRAYYEAITQLQKMSAEVSTRVREPERVHEIQAELARRQIELARAYRRTVTQER